MKKPTWVVEKERAARAEGARPVWLFGLHAVRDALLNPARTRLRLITTRNAADRLGAAIAASGMTPEIADPRRFPAPLDPGSVHQGAAMEVRPLDWGTLGDVCATGGTGRPVAVLLDRVTDPHNVGAILRSASVFGAAAVVAPARHAAPETGALAKAASGALEHQPYLRVTNLARAMETLRALGYVLVGLDGNGDATLDAALSGTAGRPVALVLGAEGPGLRQRTRETCDVLCRIGGGVPVRPDASGPGAVAAMPFASLNVSNAAAVALYATRRAEGADSGV